MDGRLVSYLAQNHSLQQQPRAEVDPSGEYRSHWRPSPGFSLRPILRHVAIASMRLARRKAPGGALADRPAELGTAREG